MKLQSAGLSLLGLLTMLASGCGSGHVEQVEASGVGETPAVTTSTAVAANPPVGAQKVTIPTGTPIEIRLQEPISTRTANPGDNFAFVLAEPLEVEGKAVIDTGATGIGRVVAARKSGRLHDSGYLRIALVTLNIAGSQVPMQSSSVVLFAGGKRNWVWRGNGGTSAAAIMSALAGSRTRDESVAPTNSAGKQEVGFTTDQRLTFRLSQPLQIHVMAN